MDPVSVARLLVALVALQLTAWGLLVPAAWRLATALTRIQERQDAAARNDQRIDSAIAAAKDGRGRIWSFARRLDVRVRALEYRAGIDTPQHSAPEDFDDGA